jgi:hypothetical protein
MSKRKKRKFKVEYAGRRWTAEGYYNSPSDCKRAFIQDLIDSPDPRVVLRVKMKPKKQFIFLDCVFEIGSPELWPDDEQEFYAWALEAIRKNLTVKPFVKQAQISEKTMDEINMTLESIDDNTIKALDIKKGQLK